MMGVLLEAQKQIIIRQDRLMEQVAAGEKAQAEIRSGLVALVETLASARANDAQARQIQEAKVEALSLHVSSAQEAVATVGKQLLERFDRFETAANLKASIGALSSALTATTQVISQQKKTLEDGLLLLMEDDEQPRSK
jgi:hypothetical protein